MDTNMMEKMRQAIRLGARRNRKTAAFYAQLIINSGKIEITDGEHWVETVEELLEAIDMPLSYVPQVKSILWAVQELRVHGYVVGRPTKK